MDDELAGGSRAVLIRWVDVYQLSSNVDSTPYRRTQLFFESVALLVGMLVMDARFPAHMTVGGEHHVTTGKG